MVKDNWFLQVGKQIQKNREKKQERTIKDLTKEKEVTLKNWQESSEGNVWLITTLILIFVACLLTRGYYNNINEIDIESRLIIKIFFYLLTIGLASLIFIMEIISNLIQKNLRDEIYILNKKENNKK